MQEITGLEWLLSAWDEPRKGGDAYGSMDEGLRYLQRVHGAVLRASGMAADPAALCRHVLRELGQPEGAANPLAVRSVEANLRAKGHRGLQKE